MNELMQTFPVVQIRTHHAGLKSFYFKRTTAAVAGQFVNLWLPGIDEKPFSISDLTLDLMEITVKAVGPFTKALMNCQVGDYLGIRGPLGNGFRLADQALLIGGGSGIAPLRFLAKSLHQAGQSFHLALGAKSQEELIFRADFQQYLTDFTTEDGSFGYKGRVTEIAGEILTDKKIAQIYAAGPEAMLKQVIALAIRTGIPCQISFERYMKCGLGLCGQCCLDGSGIRLCVEGPILSLAEILQVTEIGLPPRDASGRRDNNPIGARQ